MKKIFVSFIFLLTGYLIFAKTGYYRLIIKSDPATSYTLGWIQINGHNPVVYYDTWENYERTGKLSQRIDSVKTVKYKKDVHAFVEITGLKPGTKYAVRIDDSNSKSALMWFETFPVGDDIKLSIIAGGDSRTRRHVRRMADRMVGKLQPDMVIFDGDFTTMSKPFEWRRWFKDWQLTIHDGRLIPVFVVPGNHETAEDVVIMFDLGRFVHGYYSADISGGFLHLVSLNTQYKIPGEQTQWFENDLAANKDATWTFVAYHKPMRPHYSGKREGEQQYKYWAPVIYKYRVPLVLEGDTHTHKITYPVVPDENGDQGFSRNDSLGTVYVGEGCWGAPLRPADDPKSWTLDAASIDQFKWLWVTRDSIVVRTVEYHSVYGTAQLTPQTRFSVPEGIKLRILPGGKTYVIVRHPEK